MKKAAIVLAALLLVSLGGNVFQLLRGGGGSFVTVNFENANSRDTYFSIHNIRAAQEAGTGAGVRVGILDWGFGFEEHEGLYAGGRDFSGNPDNFNHTNEHGYWMASVLREVAPDCEVYALGTFIDNEGPWVDALVEAVDWAVENDLDILTLSHQMISPKNRPRFDEAVDRAVAAGVVTTFIHYDNPNNILPYPLEEGDGGYGRMPDVNIFPYDYNTLFVPMYVEYLEKGEDAGYIPYYSFSSMSPVTAGFVAILKSVDDSLTPAQYKEILVASSYPLNYEGKAAYAEGTAPHVVDIAAAVAYLQENY